MLVTLQYENMGGGDHDRLLDFDAQGSDIISIDINFFFQDHDTPIIYIY